MTQYTCFIDAWVRRRRVGNYEEEPHPTLFGRLLARCQQRAPRHGFRFKNKLYAVDVPTIDLCLAAFPWA